MSLPNATIIAGIPARNFALYHAIRFSAGDPAAFIETPGSNGRPTRTLIIRDIEMGRARKHAKADRVACPADFAPEGGLAGDRETATAQAAAECLVRAGVRTVRADRTLPLIFAETIRAAGIAVELDPDLGVSDRRRKDEREVDAMRAAQAMTESAVRMACETIARAAAARDGTLMHGGEPLTAERLRFMIDVYLLERNYENAPAIVACGPEGEDCHNLGRGPLRTGQPIIVDVFPRDRATLYCGDCTRTVVHGDAPDWLVAMHAAVVQAKAAGTAAIRAGAAGEAAYQACLAAIQRAGWDRSLLAPEAPEGFCSLQHGLGHGVGLEVHEPPLLDLGGPVLVAGDAVTVEPGLYAKGRGGVRIEDVVIVRENGCENLGTLPEGLCWR
ncbi:MAG: aminopeptidase P family protein [Leptolyngbya sp. PLA2]|nr:aminopeptidase P family protein [Leptolyngbya sp. PL-A2]MCQ3940507.1 hypothetical protein [cyanobacterium CYA1]MCZ7633972.1 M24 family metallopeptidase [Phycisphaerales bacterium]MDL1904357.1 aminopeptidase P family protein [Synechococcales cyanobacterium CNB]GIK19589.1 MAG: Xaa-Pro aminopeptidase [Planctomycetota bacterium]